MVISDSADWRTRFFENKTQSVEITFGANIPCQPILQNNKNKEDNSGSVPKRKFQ